MCKSQIALDLLCRNNIWWKQVILKISQYSQKIFTHIKKVILKFFIRKRLQHKYFFVNIAKFFKTAFVVGHRWLLSSWPYKILWMIYELIAFSSCAMSYAHVSIITNLQLGLSKYKRENDKQKCLLMIFFRFCSWKCILHMRF